MKNLRRLPVLLALLLALITVHSCQKDEIFVEPDTVSEPKSDTDENTRETPGAETPDAGEPDTPPNDDGDEGIEGAITLYRVDGENLVKEKDYPVNGKDLEFQKDVDKHQEIWKLTKKLIPPRYLKKMSRFMIFSGAKDGTAGYVFDDSLDLSKWHMGIAIDFAYYNGVFNEDGELAYTIIHEFGHILTLNKEQVNGSIFENECPNFYTGEGCAKKEAYINQLYTKFWADIYKEFSAAKTAEQQEKFFEKYEDRFVTAYASTNPIEDIAEVFATFVTRNEGVKGTSIAEQKIQLMYDSPELIDLRNFIRKNTGTAKGRAYLPVACKWKRANTFGNPEMNCTKHGK